jgi:hypothetical protein
MLLRSWPNLLARALDACPRAQLALLTAAMDAVAKPAAAPAPAPEAIAASLPEGGDAAPAVAGCSSSPAAVGSSPSPSSPSREGGDCVVAALFDGLEPLLVLRARHTEGGPSTVSEVSSRYPRDSEGEGKAAQKNEAVRGPADALVEVLGAKICSSSSGLSEARLRRLLALCSRGSFNCDAIKEGVVSLALGLPAGALAPHTGLLLRALCSATLGDVEDMSGTLLIQLLRKLPTEALPDAHARHLIDLVPHADARVRDLATEVLRAQPSALLPHVRLLIRTMGLNNGEVYGLTPARALLLELKPSVLAPHVPLLLVAFQNKELSSATRDVLETLPGTALAPHTSMLVNVLTRTCSFSGLEPKDVSAARAVVAGWLGRLDPPLLEPHI